MDQGSWDYIIVGAGSAGCVLANRLSADGRSRVLLLEAGRASHPLSALPISYGALIRNPAANWCYESEPEDGMNRRAIPVPRGKLLGGSSSINGLVFVRGQPRDYDTWAQLGNRGWSFDDLLPLFRRMEDFEGGDDALRATGGPLHVSVSPDESPLYDALFEAGAAVGLPRNPDYNGASQEGMAKTQTTIRNGRRMSAAHCYLKPARGRANLRIVTEAHARHLLFEGSRCTGVAWREGDPRTGPLNEARAGREVILSAGSIGTPQLLEVSGIGNPDILGRHGIETRHRLDGVGENLRDHIAPRMVWRITQKGITYNDRVQGLGLAWQALRYAVTRKGFLSIPSGPVLAFLRTRPELESPDMQVHFVPFAIKDISRRKLHEFPGMTVSPYQLRPESVGDLHIRSADPADAPAIRFNFLSAETDRRSLLDGLRIIRRLIAAPPMARLVDSELVPGREVESDEALLAWIRDKAETAYHPVGTAKMGTDPRAVVDPRLKLIGMTGLRVADASIMPTLVSGNTNGPAIMIGEKAADLILEDRDAA